ncbi:MAG TPA: DUF2442 domain-containing protein [Stellaceae bacterium]|nr:DUF2442 domain-containing protein [Stellaceae bacterium]
MDADTPRIMAVRAANARRLTVTWKGDGESTIDVADFLAKFEMFHPLDTDDALFGKVEVGEWGWCVHWTNEMEISADTLRRLALEQGSAWLRDWRAKHRMTEAEAADALGIGIRMWRRYEAGLELLPKTVRLASIGLDAQAEAA